METDLELYRIFRAVSEEKSFSGAARKLYISQPAVSQSVKQLEETLGVSLFIRGARGVALTKEGELIERYVNSALNLLDAGEKRLSELRELTAGDLRIGASDTVSRWFLLPAIEAFHTAYPHVVIHITNRTSSETIELLREGRIDIGFVNMPISAGGVTIMECSQVHDVFVAGKGFEHLFDRKLTLAEVAENPLIMLERASNSRRWVDKHFMNNGVALKPEIELGAHDLLLNFAGIGLGVACVIEEFAPQIPGLRKLELIQPVPPRYIGVCTLSGIEPTQAAREFIRFVRGR